MTGDEARALRRTMRMSARALAEKIGTNESSIYRWEWRRDHAVPRMYEHALRHVFWEYRRDQRQDDGDDDDGPAAACL